MSGLDKVQLETLAKLYADPTRKWFPTGQWALTNIRGVGKPINLQYSFTYWKISIPGCGPFSLTVNLLLVI